jgi:catechol 2,3-dioxygenase-like lactoylglutathione lyase family enzyme
MTATSQLASVRYVVDDVAAAIDFYTTHLGFRLASSAVPAFADVTRPQPTRRPHPDPTPAPDAGGSGRASRGGAG